MDTNTTHEIDVSVAEGDGSKTIDVDTDMPPDVAGLVADGEDKSEVVIVDKETLNGTSASAVEGENEHMTIEVDAGSLHDTTVSVADGDPGGDLDELSQDNELNDGISSTAVLMGATGSSLELLTRVELNLACASEKLVNLNILMMHVVARENDLEAFVSDEKDVLVDNADKALEFDFLSGIYDSEVSDVEEFTAALQREILKAHEAMSSYEHLGESFLAMKEKLHDSEESLRQSQEQVLEMKMQSAKFQRFLSNVCRGEKYDEMGGDISENGDLLEMNSKIKMQTSEQQRTILRMLEKSLAREIDLEQKLAESKQMEEELKHRLRSSAQEVLTLEEELAAVIVRLFEADNTAEVFMSSSKDLMGRLQICQLHLNNAVRREDELKAKLQTSSEAFILKEEGEIKDLKEKLVAAESKADSLEGKCKLMEDTNAKLNEELGHLRNSGLSEKAESLEKQLREVDIQLQHAVASVEASQEKQSMLYSSINDMDNLIEDLKSRVSKAECRADDAEDKCIILSETNAELNDELTFLRGKIECLESSMHQQEKTKVTTAKDINGQAKLITDLVMQLAIERERLQKQISSVMEENRYLMGKFEDVKKTSTHRGGKEGFFSKSNISNDPHKTKDRVGKEQSPANELDRTDTDVLGVEAELDSKSELETIRAIDTGRLNFKHILGAILITMTAVFGVRLCQQENWPF